MNGVPVRIRRQKNSTWIPAKLGSITINSTGTKLSQFEVPKLEEHSDLSIGFASFTSEFHIYLLRLFGQTEFFENFVHLIFRAARLLGRDAEISEL